MRSGFLAEAERGLSVLLTHLLNRAGDKDADCANSTLGGESVFDACKNRDILIAALISTFLFQFILPGAVSAAAFTAVLGVFALELYLERREEKRADKFEADLALMKEQIANLKLNRVLNGGR